MDQETLANHISNLGKDAFETVCKIVLRDVFNLRAINVDGKGDGGTDFTVIDNSGDRSTVAYQITTQKSDIKNKAYKDAKKSIEYLKVDKFYFLSKNILNEVETRKIEAAITTELSIKATCFSARDIAPNIFEDLDTVYKEIREPLRSQLDNQIRFLKNIYILQFTPKGENLREFAELTKTLGRGESACMVYCRYNHDVVGSSNLRDIKEYCQMHRITYLTTIDFLYYAIRKNLITIAEANSFIKQVQQKDSKLPNIDFTTFVSSVQI